MNKRTNPPPGDDLWAGLGEIAQQAGAALARFGAPAAESFSRMQGLLGELAGQGRIDVDRLVLAWQRELERLGPLAGMAGDGVKAGLGAMDGLPPLGLAREHAKRAQAFAQAQADYQQGLAAYTALVAQAQQRAYPLFQAMLERRAAKKAAIDSARELFDLWVDAAEAAWQDVASSPEFREVYGALVNAQSRVQAGMQAQMEPMCRMYGVATRRDLDAATRRLHDLERELRELKQGLAGAAPQRKPKPAEKPASKPAATKKAAARKTARKQAATGKGAAASPSTRRPAAAASRGAGKPRR